MALYALSSVFNVCCDSLYPLPSLWLPRISSPAPKISSPPTSGITTPLTCSRTSLLLLAIPLSCIILFYLLKYSDLCQRRQWHPTPVLLPGKSHGWRSLVGCSPWGRWVRHDWATSLSLFTFMHWTRKWQPTPVFLPGESQGQRNLVGCHLWGRTASDTTEAT